MWPNAVKPEARNFAFRQPTAVESVFSKQTKSR